MGLDYWYLFGGGDYWDGIWLSVDLGCCGCCVLVGLVDGFEFGVL